MKYFIYSLLGIILIMPSCGKKKPFDYRKEYVGEYHFEYRYTDLSGTEPKDTLFIYDGTIDYGEKGQIKVEWFDGGIHDINISKDGYMKMCETDIGKIENNQFELYFDEYLCTTEPIGGAYTVEMNGTKK